MLEKGQQIGRYKIHSAIGAGGMGEVYLARDTMLDRSVALKILPSDVASNQERMRRFVQEAKAAAALNHPNIAHIYEIGETDETHFIAMEYVEGVTLTEKIYQEKAPFGKLLKYLIQAAEGLAKAHAAGIVHRDLKPDNILIAQDDYAKILDFGLAKLIQPQREAKSTETAALGEAATAIFEQHSVPGMIMGTAGYMSPEQAQGKVKEIDHRSDIFSFGCILFEAVTRRKAFEGKDQIDSLYKIIHAPTPQIKEIKAAAPVELQKIVRRCLAKDPEKRYQSIKDVAIELDELSQELKGQFELEHSVQPTLSSKVSGNGDAQTVTETAVQSTIVTPGLRESPSTSSAEYIVSSVKRHKTGAITALTLFLITLAGISYGIYKLTAKENKPAFISLQSAKFARLTNTGKVVGVSISPDGKYIAHVMEDGGEQSLWIRQTATTSNIQIVPPNEITYRGLTFSPDGNYLYYSVGGDYSVGGEFRTLYQVPALGGTPRKLLTGIDNSVTFSPDGKQIAFFRRSITEGDREDALMIANADGTGERKLARRGSNERFHRGEALSSPSWSPDGKTIAIPFGSFAENNMTVATVSVESGEVKILTSQRWYAVRQVAWLADGSGILFNALEHSAGAPYQIWQVSPATGEAQRVTNDLISYRSFSLTANSDALAAVQGDQEAHIWVMPASDSTRATQITAGRNSNTDLIWTPDSRIIYLSNASGGVDLFLTDSRGSNPKQLTANSGTNRSPSVTPDGRFIVFTSDRAGPPNIWRMDFDGGNQKRLTDGFFDNSPHVSPDGGWIVYQSYSGKPILRKIGIDGGQPVQLTDYISARPVISPDGKQIACVYQENVGSPVKIAVLSSEGGAPLKIFPVVPEAEPNIRWTADGREIAFASMDKGVSNLWAQPIDGGKSRKLTNFTSDRIYWFDFSHDGKQIAVSRGTTTGDVVLIKDFR
jgi:serine/threonine protein kinase/Tol biopolymer transport system component